MSNNSAKCFYPKQHKKYLKFRSRPNGDVLVSTETFPTFL